MSLENSRSDVEPCLCADTDVSSGHCGSHGDIGDPDSFVVGIVVSGTVVGLCSETVSGALWATHSDAVVPISNSSLI